MRSDIMKKGFERAPHRSLMSATGIKPEDIEKPFIGVCNSYTNIVPGHCHLKKVGEIICEEIRKAGGVPYEFNTIAICDGIAMGHSGMKYSLPSRELIADCVESMGKAHPFDGMICIPNCDKIVPGMLMAAMRLDIPTIFASGGPMAAGKGEDGEATDLITVFEGVAKHKIGKMSESELQNLECSACPGAGSCSGMFTANSMNCLCEALGIALPGNGTILAEDEARVELWKTAARRAVEIAKAGTPTAKQFANETAFHNALTLDMAMGGSTNTVLHTLAVANEAGTQLDLKKLDAISRKTPNICKVSPSSKFHIEDVAKAGGIMGILKEINNIDGLLDTSAPMVSGKTLGEQIAEAPAPDGTVIHTLDNAYSKDGGLAILFGNLAENGSVVKTAGVAKAMMVHRGPAVIFESQEEACDGILEGKVKAGDVVVIRYEGPKGGPGMQEMLAPTSYIMGRGLGEKVALITDGRFSGGTHGACIGHISPEAAAGGIIGLVEDGDMISIDIPNRKIELEVSDKVLAERRTKWQPREPKIKTGWLARYAMAATSADTGGILKVQ
jgi:dihydroxy-acid dehydratase